VFEKTDGCHKGVFLFYSLFVFFFFSPSSCWFCIIPSPIQNESKPMLWTDLFGFLEFPTFLFLSPFLPVGCSLVMESFRRRRFVSPQSASVCPFFDYSLCKPSFFEYPPGITNPPPPQTHYSPSFVDSFVIPPFPPYSPLQGCSLLCLLSANLADLNTSLMKHEEEVPPSVPSSPQEFFIGN